MVLFCSSLVAQSELDIITFENNTTIRGTIKSFNAKGLQIEPDFTDDSVRVKYDNIKQVISFSNFFIHDKTEGYFGRFISVQNGELLLEDDEKKLHRVKPSEIYRGVLKSDYQKSFFTRLKYDNPYWQSWVDFSLDAEDGAVYKEKYLFGFYLERRKAPSRLEIAFDLAYDTQASAYDSNDTATTKNEVQGHISYEHDTSEEQFVYITPALMYDKVRGIKYRFFPSIGVGHRFYDSKDVRFQVQVGIGEVWENFFDYAPNKYTAAHTAMSGLYRFENGININATLFYMPDIKGTQFNWLGNYSAEIAIPLVNMISFRLKVTHTFDSNPSPEVGANKIRVVSGFRFDLI